MDGNGGINQENEEKKVYDWSLIRRLMGYAKKHWKAFLFALLLLLASTIADIARPYLIKVAIDDCLNSYNKPMILQNNGKPGAETVTFEGRVYNKVSSIPPNTNEKDIFSIEYIDKTAYLINGYTGNQNTAKWKVTPGNEALKGFNFYLSDGSRKFAARKLTDVDIKVFRGNDLSKLSALGILFLLAVVLGFVFNFLQTYILSSTGQTIIFNIRQEVFSHLQRLPMSFFDRNPIGRLVTRVTNDTEALNEMFTNVIVSLSKDVFIIVGVLIAIFKMDVGLSLITVATLPVVAVISIVFRIKARPVYRKVRANLARINATLSENLSGIRIVQIFNREKEKLAEFKHVNDDYYNTGMKEVVVSGIYRPSIEMIAALATAALIWYGGGRVMIGALQFGVLFAFINYIGVFFQPINDMAEKYNILQSAMAASERIFGLLDTPAEADNGIKVTDDYKFTGDIEFNNVWFAYNDEEWVLRDVSFKVPAGKTLAIVGATGAGKTSIINLINRFYEIQKGEILIDGVNTADISKDTLRKNVGVVLQDVFLFSGSISDNIRLNESGISDENVKKAAEYVNAGRFIERLPGGYSEEVVERGGTFSSGQRQLLAFARALAFDPSILILDEATANIDTETEMLIQDALYKLTRNRTTIVIAHRLSTIQHADNIIVLHKGKIREMGKHQELLARKGIYYNLYKLQYESIR